MLRFIRPVLPPPAEWLPHLEESYVRRHFTNFGPAATRLEHALAESFGGGREVVLTANATAGLTAALLALNIEGRVALPGFTFPATASAIVQANCTPVFCDVKRDTWELDPEYVAKAHAAAPLAAIVAVRAFGLCRDLSPLQTLASRWRIPLIIDAAAALGGRLVGGEFVGGQGDVEVFSLHATKAFGIGEGGAIFAAPELTPALRCAVNFGLEAGDVAAHGMNAKMSDFHAAIGLALLPHFPAHVARRRIAAKEYRRLAATMPGVTTASQPGWPVWQSFPMLLPPEADVVRFVADIATAGVEVRRYYHPALPDTTCWRGACPPVCADLAARMICLPVYSDMARHEIAIVADAVRQAWQQAVVAKPAAAAS